MKKLLIVLLCLCLCFSLFATGLKTSYFNFGVGLSVSGRSDSVSSVTLDAVYVPFDFSYCNPSLLAWTTASWDGAKSFSFGEFGFGLSLELGRFDFNPLQFTSNNPNPWAPSVTLGLVYNKEINLYVEASIFRVIDKDYMFEWFSPFAVINKDYKLWGVTIFKYTPLYHIGKEDRI